MTNYSISNLFKVNAVPDARAVVEIYNSIEALEGMCPPESFLKAAADPRCPIHGSFEWDDRIAGHAYRLAQARQILASIRFEDATTDGVAVPMFISVSTEAGRGYMRCSRVKETPGLISQVLESVLAELRQFKEKHKTLEKYLGGVFTAIDKAEEEYRRKREREKAGRSKVSAHKQKLAKARGDSHTPAKNKNRKRNHRRGVATHGA